MMYKGLVWRVTNNAPCGKATEETLNITNVVQPLLEIGQRVFPPCLMLLCVSFFLSLKYDSLQIPKQWINRTWKTFWFRLFVTSTDSWLNSSRTFGRCQMRRALAPIYERKHLSTLTSRRRQIINNGPDRRHMSRQVGFLSLLLFIFYFVPPSLRMRKQAIDVLMARSGSLTTRISRQAVAPVSRRNNQMSLFMVLLILFISLSIGTGKR